MLAAYSEAFRASQRSARGVVRSRCDAPRATFYFAAKRRRLGRPSKGRYKADPRRQRAGSRRQLRQRRINSFAGQCAFPLSTTCHRPESPGHFTLVRCGPPRASSTGFRSQRRASTQFEVQEPSNVIVGVRPSWALGHSVAVAANRLFFLRSGAVVVRRVPPSWALGHYAAVAANQRFYLRSGAVVVRRVPPSWALGHYAAVAANLRFWLRSGAFVLIFRRPTLAPNNRHTLGRSERPALRRLTPAPGHGLRAPLGGRSGHVVCRGR